MQAELKPLKIMAKFSWELLLFIGPDCSLTELSKIFAAHRKILQFDIGRIYYTSSVLKYRETKAPHFKRWFFMVS